MTLPAPSATSSPPFVPLARARDGTPIPLPDGGFAWRVRRHTGGRPRLHLDGSKQPMQLSLSYTMADLDDILPPGAYKLDLVDRSGMPLGLTIDVEIGTLRNANPAESQDLDDGPVALTVGASDVRYLLEANVRSTQLAFQHNQRTLPRWTGQIRPVVDGSNPASCSRTRSRRSGSISPASLLVASFASCAVRT